MYIFINKKEKFLSQKNQNKTSFKIHNSQRKNPYQTFFNKFSLEGFTLTIFFMSNFQDATWLFDHKLLSPDTEYRKNTAQGIPRATVLN